MRISSQFGALGRRAGCETAASDVQEVGDGRANSDASLWKQCVLFTTGCNDKL